jgi:hypothetical protein
MTLDGMVQRLVQKLVWEVDSKHKGAGEPPPPQKKRVATTPKKAVVANQKK